MTILQKRRCDYHGANQQIAAYRLSVLLIPLLLLLRPMTNCICTTFNWVQMRNENRWGRGGFIPLSVWQTLRSSMAQLDFIPLLRLRIPVVIRYHNSLAAQTTQGKLIAGTAYRGIPNKSIAIPLQIHRIVKLQKFLSYLPFNLFEHMQELTVPRVVQIYALTQVPHFLRGAKPVLVNDPIVLSVNGQDSKPRRRVKALSNGGVP